MQSQILLEASYFQDQGEKTWYDWGGGGKIQWTDDNIFAGNTVVSTWAPNSQVFEPPYPYTLDNTEDVPAIVMASAGAFGKEVPTVSIENFRSIFNTGTLSPISSIKASRYTLNFHLNETSNINVVLYDNMGKIQANVLDGIGYSGFHSINLDSYGLSQGVYYADFRLNSIRQGLKIINY